SNQLRSFPTGIEVDQVRRKYYDFEQVQGERALRVPFVDRVGNEVDSRWLHKDNAPEQHQLTYCGAEDETKTTILGRRDRKCEPLFGALSSAATRSNDLFHYHPDGMEHCFLNEIAEEASRRDYVASAAGVGPSATSCPIHHMAEQVKHAPGQGAGVPALRASNATASIGEKRTVSTLQEHAESRALVTVHNEQPAVGLSTSC
ncbi:unnamed protein product, partial [Amoebophrya sp. A120]